MNHRMDRGKRLSRGNIIGVQGEAAFQQWALKQNLTANKAAIDVGVDFFCQEMSPVENSSSIEATGSTLGAQIKTVADDPKPYLTLDRVDATDLLRQNQVTCLFGLRLSDATVHFQFVTREFIDQLLGFLETEQDEFSIRYDQMASDLALFHRLLQKYSSPFEQMRLRIHLIKRRVSKAITGAHLIIGSTDENTVCDVFVPWASSAFAVEPSAREKVRLKVLREGTIDPEEQGVKLHPAIMDAFTQSQSSQLRLAGVARQKMTIQVQWQGRHATEPFHQHAFETEIACVHRAGLRLTWNTNPEKTPNGFVHALESEVFHPQRTVPLTGNTLRFFRLFRPGATLTIRSGWDMPLSSFGDSLERIGDFVDPIPDLCEALSLPLSRVALADIEDEEFSRTVWFLQAMLLRGISLEHLVSGFILGPAVDLPFEQVPSVPIFASVPLVMNWKDTGIVIWTECEGDGFLHEELLCGLQLKQQRSWKIEKTHRFEKSVYPELWADKDWPAVKIGSAEDGKHNWIFDPSKTLPLEARIMKAEGSASEKE